MDSNQKRQREVFNKFVHLYNDRLTGFILIRISGSLDDAEEIAQNVWSKAWEILCSPSGQDKYDPSKGSLYAWLINYLAIPKIKDWIKSKWKTIEWTDTTYEQSSNIMDLPDNLVLQEEELSLINSAFYELFRLTFLCGGYPHQQLAFALMKHIYGKQSKRAIEGDARKVDAIYGNKTLEDVLVDYLVEYRRISQVDDEKFLKNLSEYIKPVKDRLDLKVETLINPFPSYLEELYSKDVKNTNFRDYYVRGKQSGTHPLTYWCDRLQERMRSLLRLENTLSDEAIVREIINRKEKDGLKLRPGSCSKCKLRHVPPCSKVEQKKL
jgi:DNA-directed RNA polymerase specialized sigma24 family protein